MIGEASEDPKKIRAMHNLRTEQCLEKWHDKVYLSPHEARIVGKICRGHTFENLNDEYYADVIFGANIPIRIRFLSACLRIADECDVTSNRTPEIIYYSLNPTDKAEEEFKKHLSISGIGRPATEKHKILLFGIAWDPKGVKVLELVRDKIQNELNNIKVFLAQQGVIIDYLELRVDTRGFINKPIEFLLDRKKIVDLLIGTNLYSRKDCAIRELLQNAVDTCRLKKALEKNYQPSIKFCFSKDKISVEDNGLGMNFEDAINFLSNKGSSFYTSKEFKDLIGEKQFVPISKFGIGVLSCFLIGSRVIIESKKRNCVPCKFVIENLAEAWRYEEGSRVTEGTEITLFLDEESEKIDVENALQHYAKKIEIPINLVNEDKGQSKILQQQWDPSMPEIMDGFIGRIFDRTKAGALDIKKDTINSETILGDGLEASYFLLRDESLFNFSKNCFLSYQGVYVGNFDFFEHSGNWFVLINCTKEIIDLSVSRENLVESDKNRKFFMSLYGNFLKFIETVLKFKEPYDFDYCIRYSKLLHQLISDSLLSKPRDVKREFFLNVEPERRVHIIFDSNGLRFLKGNNICLSSGTKKIYHYILPLAECEHHIRLVIPYLKKLIKKDEMIVFDIGPNFEIFNLEESRIKSVWQILCENKRIRYERLDLFRILRNLSLTKTDTPIDVLLPRNTAFAEIPADFRSIVIYKKPYKFRPLSPIRGIDSLCYSWLVARELFGDEPPAAELYGNFVLRASPKGFEKTSDGEFLYDANDPFMKLIIQNHEKILSNEVLKRLVNIYLKGLSFTSLHHSFFELDPCYLLLVERIIATELGQTNLCTFNKRAGKMNAILEGYKRIMMFSVLDLVEGLSS